jgi:hypothetical protein
MDASNYCCHRTHSICEVHEPIQTSDLSMMMNLSCINASRLSPTIEYCLDHRCGSERSCCLIPRRRGPSLDHARGSGHCGHCSDSGYRRRPRSSVRRSLLQSDHPRRLCPEAKRAGWIVNKVQTGGHHAIADWSIGDICSVWSRRSLRFRLGIGIFRRQAKQAMTKQ